MRVLGKVAFRKSSALEIVVQLEEKMRVNQKNAYATFLIKKFTLQQNFTLLCP